MPRQQAYPTLGPISTKALMNSNKNQEAELKKKNRPNLTPN